MSILTPTVAVIIIWALFVILTITIIVRFYAIRIHDRRNEEYRARHPNQAPSSRRPRNGIFTSKAVLTAVIMTLHCLALLYCAAATLAIIWGYNLANKRHALVIQYGGAETDVGNALVGDGEIGRFRWSVQKVGLAMELGYVVIIWTLKSGLVSLGWQVGKSLGLWGMRSTIESEAEKVNIPNANGENAGSESPIDAGTKARISMAKAVLYTLGCGTFFTFLGVVICEAIVIGMALSRNEFEDITSNGLRKEVAETQIASIVSAAGSLGTYLLSIVLLVILLSISRSSHQSHHHPRPPTIFLYGGIFILSFIVLTTAASSARTCFVLKNTTSIQPRIGDLITGGILFGSANDSTYGEALGLNQKVFSVLEMMLGGIALCIPGLQVLFDSARRHGSEQTRQNVKGKGRDEGMHRLQVKSNQPSPATTAESTFRPMETRDEIVPVVEQKDNVIQQQGMGYNTSPHVPMTGRNGSVSQGSEAIGTRAITGRDRSRSSSRNRSRRGSSTGRNGLVTPGLALRQQGNEVQMEEQVQRLEEQQRKQKHHQEQDRGRTEGKMEEHYNQSIQENGSKTRSEEAKPTIPTKGDTDSTSILPSSRQPQQLLVSSAKELPPLPPANEWEQARDRELRRITAVRQLR